MSLLNEEIFTENVRESLKEVKTELESESTGDYESLKLRMKRKITDFFNIHKYLSYQNFEIFMDYIDLTQIFSKDELEVIWKTFTIIAEDREVLDLNEAIRGVNELLRYFYSDSSENEGVNINNNEDDNKYKTEDNYEITYENNKNKLSSDVTSPMVDLNNSDKVEHNIQIASSSNRLQTNNNLIESSFYMPNEITKSRNNSVNLPKNYINNSNNTSAFKTKKPHHERKITKIFKEIDIETLKQLRRVFSLLDIRNKEYLYLRELHDILKYKFINLKFDQILEFLQYLSYDLDNTSGKPNFNNNVYNIDAIQKQGKISINFELYSRAISAIEQKILNDNFEEFHEALNESYEIKENFQEVFENLNQLDSESKDYISVIADIFITMRQKFENASSEINSNLSSVSNILNNKIPKEINKNVSEPALINKSFEKNLIIGFENIRAYLTEYFKSFKNKLDDIEIFLKDLNKNNIQNYNKMNLLKLISEKYESNIKSLQDDYKMLFEKYNTTQPVEISDEMEMLLDENAYLKDELENKINIIESARNELREKEDKIMNMNYDVERIQRVNMDIEDKMNQYKRNSEEIQKEYEKLRNEIYEKIILQEEKENSRISEWDNLKNSPVVSKLNVKQDSHEMNSQATFLKEKLICEEPESANKILKMSYDKLVLYCLDIEKANGKFNAIFAKQEVKIKDLEQEIENLNNQIHECNKKIYVLTNENTRLNTKINDILRENDFNKGFRPSIALNNRISRISNIGGVSIRPGLNNNSNACIFETNKNKNNAFFAFDKNKINNILQNQNVKFDSNTNSFNNTTKEISSDKNIFNLNTINKSVENENNNYSGKRLDFSQTMQTESSLDKMNNQEEHTKEKPKDSIFDVYKGKKHESNSNMNENRNETETQEEKEEIRLSRLELDNEFDLENQINFNCQNKRIIMNVNDEDNEINEAEINNYNKELIRENMRSAGHFDLRPNISAIPNQNNQYNNFAQERRISNLDCNPFDFDEETGLMVKPKNDILDEDLNTHHVKGEECLNYYQNDKNIICATDNLFENYNIKDKNKISEVEQINIPNTNKNSNQIDNHLTDFNLAINNSKEFYNNAQDIENSQFYNNRRYTYLSNTQGIINEISRISSFNFDTDMPNNVDETNDIINKIDLDTSCVTGRDDRYILGSTKGRNENLFMSNNTYKLNDNENNRVVQITDTIEPFENDFNHNQNNYMNKSENKQSITYSVSSNNTNLDTSNSSHNKSNLLINNNSNIYNRKENNKFVSQGQKIIEEDVEDDDFEKKDKVNPMEKVSLGSRMSVKSKPSHNRNATMDLDKEFTKPSEYMCYDFLTLRKNVAIINMLDKYLEGVSSYEMFSENVHYFDDQKKKTKRYLFITCKLI